MYISNTCSVPSSIKAHHEPLTADSIWLRFSHDHLLSMSFDEAQQIIDTLTDVLQTVEASRA